MKRQESQPGHKGQFLFLESTARRKYVSALRLKIRQGYFTSDDVLTKLVEEIAPAFNDSINPEQSIN
jgi:hypothetical protein